MNAHANPYTEGFFDYYALFEIAPSASQEEIKKAFRKKAFEFHPDRSGDKEHAHHRFILLREGYDVLMDRGARADYDALYRQYHERRRAPSSGEDGHRDGPPPEGPQYTKRTRKDYEAEWEVYRRDVTQYLDGFDSALQFSLIVAKSLVASLLLSTLMAGIVIPCVVALVVAVVSFISILVGGTAGLGLFVLGGVIFGMVSYVWDVVSGSHQPVPVGWVVKWFSESALKSTRGLRASATEKALMAGGMSFSVIPAVAVWWAFTFAFPAFHDFMHDPFWDPLPRILIVIMQVALLMSTLGVLLVMRHAFGEIRQNIAPPVFEEIRVRKSAQMGRGKAPKQLSA